MSAEPINIFSHRIDPAGVVAVVRRLAPDATVEGSEDDWRRIVIRLKKPLFGRAKVLELLHDRDYYAGADWPRQRMGMQGYFSRFPDNGRLSEVLQVIASFRFSLATSFDPDLSLDAKDERNAVLLAVARHLDGCFFTPYSLRDRSGRILVSADGEFDPEARLPAIPQEEVQIAKDQELEEEEGEPEPPTQQHVFRRLLALLAVATRGVLENDLAGDPQAKLRCTQLLEWILRVGIDDELEPGEWEVIQRGAGHLERQETIDAAWRWEGVAVLAWALSLYDLPAHDELVSPDDMWSLVGYPDPQAAMALGERARLRSEDELAWMQARLLGIHWRMRDYSIRPEAVDFVKFSKECWFGGFDLEGIRTIHRDLAIGDSQISQADEDRLSTTHSAAMERDQAINWLCWGGERYSDVDTST
jgi:uncharacterized protein DUF4272